MGNCQAVDAAALVIQHPSGKIERMYWPITASEVMKMNPGHYVSLIIPLPLSDEQNTDQEQNTIVKFTRVKLLRPCDTLILGHAYRLITSQEVMKVLRAKKQEKMKNQQESADTGNQAMRRQYQQQRHSNRQRSGGQSTMVAGRSKSWRPSLRSITESPS
ncbi:uncharacterized protein LOC124921665 [Impatiens glandulifera]|uniref:uncharacterized protein LOC124921665 n=1 Tax=Impatiens glandulifera TaxID=253017 RepID=UPI001FB0B3D2|nr:uncharacterized protein LOC124921665 [Impatiens glandulifera]